MDKNNSLKIRKESFFKKIITNIKRLFCNKKNDNIEINVVNPVNKMKESENNSRDKFAEGLKVDVDLETLSLKVKLENNEIRAIDLTDEQIDKLQRIYDKEIQEKKNKLARLKQGA